MRNKHLFALAMLATLFCSGLLISAATAQEDTSDRTVDSSAVPQGGLIAPAPEDNSTASDDGPITYSTDDNSTVEDDTGLVDSGEGNLAASTPTDNTLAFIAVGILSAAIVAGVIGAVHYRRKRT